LDFFRHDAAEEDREDPIFEVNSFVIKSDLMKSANMPTQANRAEVKANKPIDPERSAAAKRAWETIRAKRIAKTGVVA
jgi:hypothetical protein